MDLEERADEEWEWEHAQERRRAWKAPNGLRYDLRQPSGRYGAVYAALRSLGATQEALARADAAWQAIGAPWGASGE